MKKREFEVDDRVFDIRYGWGVVEHIRENLDGVPYPIHVSFPKDRDETYTLEGKADDNHVNPILSHKEYGVDGLVKGGIKVGEWNKVEDVLFYAKSVGEEVGGTWIKGYGWGHCDVWEERDIFIPTRLASKVKTATQEEVAQRMGKEIVYREYAGNFIKLIEGLSKGEDSSIVMDNELDVNISKDSVVVTLVNKPYKPSYTLMLNGVWAEMVPCEEVIGVEMAEEMLSKMMGGVKVRIRN